MGSSPPGLSSSPPPSTLLGASGVSPGDAAVELPSIATSNSGLSSSPSSSTLLNTAVGGPPVDVAAAATDLSSMPTPSQLLLQTVSEA